MNTIYVKLAPWILALPALLLGAGCSTTRPPLPTAPRVELDRFMGDWYVLAHIPLWPEKEAYNGVESYRLDDQGRIQTTYTFRKGGFDGPVKTYTPVGFVHNRETGAEWRMQFLWPFKAAFLILHVDEAYTETIIGEPDRKYFWIMARQPEIPAADFDRLVAKAGELGFDLRNMRRVPQQPTGAR